MIVADTGAIVALVDADDRHHDVLRRVFQEDADAWILPWAILPEIDDLLGAQVGARGQERFAGDLASGAWAIEWGDPADLVRAEEISRRHRSLRLGLVDSVVMAVAERRSADAIATLDLRHFGAVTLRGRHAPRAPRPRLSGQRLRERAVEADRRRRPSSRATASASRTATTHEPAVGRSGRLADSADLHLPLLVHLEPGRGPAGRARFPSATPRAGREAGEIRGAEVRLQQHLGDAGGDAEVAVDLERRVGVEEVRVDAAAGAVVVPVVSTSRSRLPTSE